MEENRNVGSRVILGMILIAIGIIYLLKSFYFPIDIEIFSFPFILIVIGIIIMLNSGNKLFGAIVFIFGLLLYFGDHITIWPFFFILWGIYIIFKHRNRRPRIFENPQPISNPDEKKDFRDDISIFGGGHKVIHSDSFKGGNITAIFGGSEIDLTQCKLAPGDNYIDVVIIVSRGKFAL